MVRLEYDVSYLGILLLHLVILRQQNLCNLNICESSDWSSQGLKLIEVSTRPSLYSDLIEFIVAMVNTVEIGHYRA